MICGKHHITSYNEESQTVTIRCPICEDEMVVKASSEELCNWMEGTHAQDAFPNLNASEREALISGTCDRCWDKMFGEEEEEVK